MSLLFFGPATRLTGLTGGQTPPNPLNGLRRFPDTLGAPAGTDRPVRHEVVIVFLVIVGTLTLAALGATFFFINREFVRSGPPADRAELLRRIRRLT